MNAITEATVEVKLSEVVDQLGLLKAQIAKLEIEEKRLAGILKASGMDKIAGVMYDATVSLSERETVDTKKLRADLGDDLIKPYLRKTDVETLKLTAKK